MFMSEVIQILKDKAEEYAKIPRLLVLRYLATILIDPYFSYKILGIDGIVSIEAAKEVQSFLWQELKSQRQDIYLETDIEFPGLLTLFGRDRILYEYVICNLESQALNLSQSEFERIKFLYKSGIEKNRYGTLGSLGFKKSFADYIFDDSSKYDAVMTLFFQFWEEFGVLPSHQGEVKVSFEQIDDLTKKLSQLLKEVNMLKSMVV